MNDWDLLLEARPDVTALSDEAYHRMKTTLGREMEQGGRHHRAYSGWITATVGASIVVAVASGIGRGGVPAANAVEVRRTAEFLEITFNDLTVPEDRVNQRLRELGVDVEVSYVPVSPSLVGTVPWVDLVDGSDEGFVWEYAGPASVRIPNRFDGRMTIGIGVPTAPGERYMSSAISAEYRGEALGCRQVTFGLASNALEIARELGVTVEWYQFPAMPLGDALPDEYRNWYVMGTAPVADGVVSIDIAPDLSAVPQETIDAVSADLQSGC